MAVVVKRFAVFLVNFDPTIDAEIKKTRPCLVISPNEMNEYIQTVIIAPMTTTSRPYPSRVACQFDAKDAFVVLDQIRTVDKRRLVKRIGEIDPAIQQQMLAVLAELFAA